MEMLSLEEAQGDLKKGCKYLVGGNEGESSRHFSAEPTVRTRGNGRRLEHSKFNLDTSKHLPIVNGSALEWIDQTGCEVSTQLDMICGNLL